MISRGFGMTTVSALLLAYAAGCGGSAPAQKPVGIPRAVVPDAVPAAQTEFEQGMRQFALGPQHYGDARAALARAVALDKNLFEAWHNLGVIAGHLGEWEEAAKAFGRALVVQPASRASLLGLGHAHVQTGNAETCHKLYRKWLDAAPDDRDVRFALIAALREGGQGVAALEESRALLAKNSHDAEAFNALGLTYRKLKRWRLAETALRRAAELAPKAAYVWNNLGLLALDQGDDAAAFSAFQKAAELDAQDVTPVTNQAVVYLDSGAYDRALPLLEQAIKTRPHDADLRVALGVALRGLRRYAEAAKQYEEALQLHPNHAPALYNLGVLFMDHQEDPGKAREALSLYAKVAPAKDPKRDDVKLRLRMLK